VGLFQTCRRRNGSTEIIKNEAKLFQFYWQIGIISGIILKNKRNYFIHTEKSEESFRPEEEEEEEWFQKCCRRNVCPQDDFEQLEIYLIPAEEMSVRRMISNRWKYI
jgi:hypothetical protein